MLLQSPPTPRKKMRFLFVQAQPPLNKQPFQRMLSFTNSCACSFCIASVTVFIYRIPKWPPFQYSFVFLANQPLLPRSETRNSKEYFPLNEATRANLQVNKRILKLWPFWNKVYYDRKNGRNTCHYVMFDLQYILFFFTFQPSSMKRHNFFFSNYYYKC